MIHIIKNNKWVIATSSISILFGVLTFFTFINQSFIKLNAFNLQALLFVDSFLLILFFATVIIQTYKIFKEKKKGKLGSETSLRYVAFFSTTTLLPAILIAIFSLFLFNVVLQKYFEKKIKSVMNNSAELAKNYVEQTQNTIDSDILLVALDINQNTNLYYENPKNFLRLLMAQRLLRRLDEIYLIDSASNIIMSNAASTTVDYIPPPEEAFDKSLEGRPVRITDPATNRTSALIKLDSFIDTYLYIIRFMDPKVMNYLKQSGEGIVFYYSVQDRKTGIKITFAIIYVLIVSLFLFLSVNIAINFSSRLTKPIVNLIDASEKISSGDLSAKVPKIQTDKEFEKLNENFNSMIEKLKKQQDKLLLSERHSAWENVARKLAHEIKNPLTPIQLSIDRLREKYLNEIKNDKKNFSNYLQTITKQIKDIEALVTEFSDFARMPKPFLKQIDLAEIIRRSINLHELSEPDIDFLISKEKFKIHIQGDEEQLNRVFINLVKNSIESIYEKKRKNVDFKGKIQVDIKVDSDYIYVTIVDNGIGFEHVDKRKMLTPYYTTKKKGSGLGLAIVTKIISDHNSLILFNSIKNGAKVEITIPKIL